MCRSVVSVVACSTPSASIEPTLLPGFSPPSGRRASARALEHRGRFGQGPRARTGVRGRWRACAGERSGTYLVYVRVVNCALFVCRSARNVMTNVVILPLSARGMSQTHLSPVGKYLGRPAGNGPPPKRWAEQLPVPPCAFHASSDPLGNSSLAD